MKFCKNLQKVADISDPEWAPYWTNYKMLKKLIKELPTIVRGDTEAQEDGSFVPPSPTNRKNMVAPTSSPQRQEHPHAQGAAMLPSSPAKPSHESNCNDDSSEDQPEGPTSSVTAKDFRKNPGEITFFKMLRSEFGKATRFFDMAQREFAIREERVKEGMDIVKKPNSIMVSEKWSALARSIYRLYKDLLLLETYAIMTYCSFSKILKKHDKVTGCVTRVAFMANVVSKANFTNYPDLLAMIERCEIKYSEVSDHLVKEGKEGLLEDERLFINMISRLNAQALENPDAPDHKGKATRRSPPLVSAVATVPGKPESLEMARLRSIVESNDAASVSEDHGDDQSVSKRKRSTSADGDSSKRQR